jgi:uncharacterized protein YndB with AHSA1/START domain
MRRQVRSTRHLAGIEVQQRVAAPLERIWKACSSAQGLMSWQADHATGEARQGGTLTLFWEAFGASLDLHVVDLVPYERIVLHHGESTVELSVDEELVILRHHGPEAALDATGLRSSWRVALAQLAHCVERHPGQNRRVRWFSKRVRCSPETAYLCFTAASMLQRWLGQTAGVGALGSETSLFLSNGQCLSGGVLANVEGRDVALSCESFDDSVLGLRTFPSEDGGRLVALVWSEWRDPRRDVPELFVELERALHRLSFLFNDSARS